VIALSDGYFSRMCTGLWTCRWRLSDWLF